MRFQQLDYSCGPACIVNALKCYGESIPEPDLRREAGTTPEEGTDDFQMVEAIESVGYRAMLYEQPGREDSWKWLLKNLRSGKPVILSVDNWKHYVTAIGAIGKRVTIFDPFKGGQSKKENGTFVLHKDELLDRWFSTTNERFSAIAVKK